MGNLKLPRLISDGMVLQQKSRVHIWGYHTPGSKVMVSFLGEEKMAITDEEGMWEVWLSDLKAGGPFNMQISDQEGTETVISDVLVGDVWMCSGQSNMELPMARVKDNYPEEIKNCEHSFIRGFKIKEYADFHGPLREPESGEWKKAGPDTILDFSATAYFFAEEMYRITGVPVGLIQASLGGSRITSWMGRDMLEGYPEELAIADKYADDAFVAEQIRKNEEQTKRWHDRLDALDQGLAEHWEKEPEQEQEKKLEQENRQGTDWENQWKTVEIPFFFKDSPLKGVIGSIWFKRSFKVPAGMAGEQARLWLGTMVDSDTVFVNGVWTGHTDYQYPPRKYEIPEGILKEGENTIVIRLKCENGEGRFTPGKRYAIWNEQGLEIDLTGSWKYRIGAVCGKIEETDFVNWKPTGLYHGMMAPCHFYTIGGIIWYQGESNTHAPEHYLDLMERLITGYRKKWKKERLPFFYVQLPNFSIDLAEEGSGWPELREKQRQAQRLPGVGMVTAIDLGEDHDLHPLNKKEIGRRLALLAGAKLYGKTEEYSGPLVDEAIIKQGKIYLQCSHTGKALYAASLEKGSVIRDFEAGDRNGIFYPAKAEIEGTGLIITCPKEVKAPAILRYCYKNTNQGALIYNEAGLPMSPFVMELEKRIEGKEMNKNQEGLAE